MLLPIIHHVLEQQDHNAVTARFAMQIKITKTKKFEQLEMSSITSSTTRHLFE